MLCYFLFPGDLILAASLALRCDVRDWPQYCPSHCVFWIQLVWRLRLLWNCCDPVSLHRWLLPWCAALQSLMRKLCA